MMEQLQFACSPEEAQDLAFLTTKIRKELNLKAQQQLHFRWKKPVSYTHLRAHET